MSIAIVTVTERSPNWVSKAGLSPVGINAIRANAKDCVSSGQHAPHPPSLPETYIDDCLQIHKCDTNRLKEGDQGEKTVLPNDNVEQRLVDAHKFGEGAGDELGLCGGVDESLTFLEGKVRGFVALALRVLERFVKISFRA